MLLALGASGAGGQQPVDPGITPADTPSVDSVLPLAPLVVSAARELAVPPPVATVVVDPAIVQHTLAENPYDLIREVADVEVHEQGQGPGFASDAVVRGFTSDHSADVLLVIDGVPVNMPIHGHGEGYADWNVLVAPAVSALRVIHGAASPLHGNFALGGVVEVFTAADAEGSTLSLGGTSDADASGWLRTGTRDFDRGWMLAAEGRRAEGWRENGDYLLGNALLRGWHAAGAGRVEGGLSLYASDWSSPGFVSIAQFNDEDVERAADPSDGGSSRRVSAHGRWSTPLAPGSTLEATAWGLASDWRLWLNIPGHDEVVSQTGERDERVAGGARIELLLDRAYGEVTTGIELRHDRAAFALNDTDARVTTEPVERTDARYLLGAGFVRWRRMFAGRFGIDAGARVDAFRYESRDALGADAWRNATSVIASPKLGARWLAARHYALFASSSRGFRGAVGVIGDPARAPILSWAHEAGVSYERGSLRGQLALFRIDVENERAQDPVTREISSEGSSTRQGIDLDLEYALGPRTTLFASGTFNDARLSSPYADAHEEHDSTASMLQRSTMGPMHDDPDAGERVPGVARFTARVGARTTLRHDVEARASLRVTGPYVPIGEPDFETQPYSVLDLGVAVPFAEHYALDVELENALDIRYAELRASGYLNPGRPRLLRVALRAGL